MVGRRDLGYEEEIWDKEKRFVVGRGDLGYEEEIWDRKRDWGWKDLTDVKVWDVNHLGIARKI